MSANRSAKTERDTPTRRASRSTVQSAAGSAWIADNACPTTGSRRPASQPVCAATAPRGDGESLRRTAAPRAARARSRFRRARCPIRARRCSAASRASPSSLHRPRRRDGCFGSAVSSGLKGRSSHPRKQHTSRDAIGTSAAELGHQRQRGRRRARTSTCRGGAHPRRTGEDVRVSLGKYEQVPSFRRIGSSPIAYPQHAPRAIRWYSMTRWRPA